MVCLFQLSSKLFSVEARLRASFATGLVAPQFISGISRVALVAAFASGLTFAAGQLTAQQKPSPSQPNLTLSTCCAQPANDPPAADIATVSDSISGDLPDDPQPQAAPTEKRNAQTKRILGIIPNFRAVSTDEKLPAMTVKQKFMTTTQDSFDYSAIAIPAMLAGYSMATDATPEFHQGAAGYGRYFWHAALDQTSENYMVGFFFPVATHEDPRYYTLGRGGLVKRTGYALSRAFVTRNDANKETFNISEVAGAGASAGLSSLYYPSRERSFTNVSTEWGLDIGIDAATFVFKEFWPDINQRWFHEQ